MEYSKVFIPSRLGLLLKRQALLNFKSWITGILAASGFLIVVSLLHTFFQSQSGFSLTTFTNLGMFVTFAGGYIFSSRIFNELHEPLKNQFFLTLPASQLEKLISAWLISGIVFVSVSFLILSGLSIVLSGSTSRILFSEIQFAVFNPFSGSNLKMAGYYLVTQSVFLLGALYFRKNNFLKTILALFLVSILLQLWWVLTFFIASYDFIGPLQEGSIVYVDGDSAFIQFKQYIPFLDYIFWVCTIPFFLLVSYFRLKERTV